LDNTLVMRGINHQRVWYADINHLIPGDLTPLLRHSIIDGPLMPPLRPRSNPLSLSELPQIPNIQAAAQVNLIYPIANNKERMLFYQRVLCHPSKQTLYDAIKKFNPFTTWPGLTKNFVNKYYQMTEETAFGRLDRTRRNMNSTASPPDSDGIDLRHSTNTPKRPRCYIQRRRLYTDASGVIDNNWYILVMFFEDLNYLHIEYLTGLQRAVYNEGYRRGIAFYKSTKIGKDTMPHFEIMDNAIDATTKDLLTTMDMTWQTVTTDTKRRNTAERAMRTAENQLICTFKGADKSLKPSQYFRLIPHAEKVLNMLRQCHLFPHMSADEALHGPHDFNAMPMAPPGHPVVSYDDAVDRNLLAAHGTLGFYIGPTPNHYRGYQVYIPSTNRTRITATLAWLPYTTDRPADVNPQTILPTPVNPLPPHAPNIIPQIMPQAVAAPQPPPQAPPLVIPPPLPHPEPAHETGGVPATGGAPAPQANLAPALPPNPSSTGPPPATGGAPRTTTQQSRTAINEDHLPPIPVRWHQHLPQQVTSRSHLSTPKTTMTTTTASSA
jgi:hypothetical protein